MNNELTQPWPAKSAFEYLLPEEAQPYPLSIQSGQDVTSTL